METRTDAPLPILLARKWLILATVVVAMAATYFISSSLQKVYSTEATLLIALPADDQSFDTVQAGQAIARSYADIIESPNIASQVAGRLTEEELDGGAVSASTSFETVPETQLLKITAEAPTPELAKDIADTYATVFTEYAEENLSDTTEAATELADEAPLPSSAARPKPVLYTIVAGIIGLALAIALAFVTHRLDRRLRSWEAIEAQFGLPLLARIPFRRRSKASVAAFEEAYRVLRTNLQYAGGGATLKTLAVISEKPGEGKTTTVARLAEAVAESGRNVITVEGDFRNPALQAELMPEGTPPLSPGLSNYLVGAATVDEVIHPAGGRPNLSVVPSGPLPPSPAALLDSDRAREGLDEFARRADLVLIDCPPLSVGADASVTSRLVDGVIIVVDLESATDRSLRDALRQLEAVNAAITGAVLNRDRAVDAITYGYYGVKPERRRVGRRWRARGAAAEDGSENGAGRHSEDAVESAR